MTEKVKLHGFVCIAGSAPLTNVLPKLTAVAPHVRTVVMESQTPSSSAVQLTFPQNAGNTPAHDVPRLTGMLLEILLRLNRNNNG